MGNKLIIDNWLLQDIGGCLSHGLSLDSSSELVIEHSHDSHSFRDVPMAGVQIEALLEFLADIVFRDSIILDSAFTDSWSENKSVFSTLLNQGLMRALDIYTHEEKLIEPRRFTLDRLCVTSTLQEAQRRNEESWNAAGVADNQYLSQVIWGTAGMLSRSHVFEAPYSGHPFRKRIIEQTIFATRSRDMVGETLQWMNEERFRLFETKAKQGSQRTAMLVLPPVSLEIIEEANDISQLIPIAYQLRDKYTKMREWMKSIQMAMDNEDPKSVAKYKKTLSAVSKDLNQAMENTESGKISLKIGFGWPSISIPVALDGVMKKFGMRAILNNQIFSPQGEKSVKKLLHMFEEDKSKIGLSVQEYLRLNRHR